MIASTYSRRTLVGNHDAFLTSPEVSAYIREDLNRRLAGAYIWRLPYSGSNITFVEITKSVTGSLLEWALAHRTGVLVGFRNRLARFAFH